MKALEVGCVIGVFLWFAGCGAGTGGADPGDTTGDGGPDALASDAVGSAETPGETATDPGGDAAGDLASDPASDPGSDPIVEDEGVMDSPVEAIADPGPDGQPDVPAPICCVVDTQCPQGWECVPIPGEIGVCKPTPEPGACWSGADCDPDQVCVGAVPCRCGQDDTADGCDLPGECRDKSPGCCDSDWDCPAHHVCTPGNTCWPEPSPGQCWTEEDCYPTQTCEGAGVCPCGDWCDDGSVHPGSCAPLPGTCCYSDDDCAEDEVCRFVDEVGHLPGRCVPSHLGPQCLGDAACCWEDDDCPGGFCQGAHGCGCIDLCPVCGACAEDQMGTCATWGVQVDLDLESATCEPSGFHPAFSSYRVSLAWHTSAPAKSTIELALNAFTGLEGSIQVDEGFVQVHAYDLSLSHWFFGQVPRVGDVILVRVRVTGQAGAAGLSAPIHIEVTQAVRDCLYPFDPACSDGGPIMCRAVPPPCDDDKVMAAIAGCERCVFPATCTCDDGSDPICLMVPPVCEGNTILAVQNGCFECVSPFTCNTKGW